jgi:hypothetical protein
MEPKIRAGRGLEAKEQAMSLDVALLGPPETVTCYCSCGHQHERENREALFEANITHNLNTMAEAAGIYKHLWRPDEIGVTTASQLIEPLRAGVAMMRADPERFEKLNAPNGWGTYDDFLPWVESYLAACEEYPDATVRADR